MPILKNQKHGILTKDEHYQLAGLLQKAGYPVHVKYEKSGANNTGAYKPYVAYGDDVVKG